MTNNANKLIVSSLDFDTIKLNLQNYLDGQSQFTDYKFAGAGFTVLLNVLAYNTHYLSYYLNMVANEMFLDSANKRESIISIAAQLGYTPRSTVAARAQITAVITPPSSPTPPAFLTINQNTSFTTSVDNTTYKFNTLEAVTVPFNSGSKTYTANLNIIEGAPLSYTWTVNNEVPQPYTIPNANIDTTTLVVRVYDNSGSTAFTVYTPGNDVEDLTPTSTVFYLREVAGSLYQIYFGDGILGKQLSDGNIIVVNYIGCNADAPNFANVFTPAQPINGYANTVVTTINAAAGGAPRETIEHVRFAAPKNYQTQNRAVTVHDYETIITENYPNVDSVSVWGGEDNVPPQYGKVFLSLKPVSGYVITENTKTTIISQILKSRNIVSVIPVIVDPTFLFLVINSTVKYNADATTNTAAAIQSLVLSTVQNFAADDIGKFNRIFRYSNLTTAIDTTEQSITNNLTTVQMQLRFSPRTTVPDTYTLSYSGNSIVPGTLSSGAFVDKTDPGYVNGQTYFFNDDGNGNIQEYKIVGTTLTYTNKTAGTINYTTGIVTLNNFNPFSIVDTSGILNITVTPSINDVTPQLNFIIVIDPEDITVNMVVNSPVTT